MEFMKFSCLNLDVRTEGLTMIIFKKRQKGETELTVPNWVAALVLVAVVLGLTVLLLKYLPAILPSL